MSKEFWVTDDAFDAIQDDLLKDMEARADNFMHEDTLLYNSLEDDKEFYKRMTWIDAYTLALQLQANTIKAYEIDYLKKTVL
jgi:hypothetical protein